MVKKRQKSRRDMEHFRLRIYGMLQTQNDLLQGKQNMSPSAMLPPSALSASSHPPITTKQAPHPKGPLLGSS